MIKLKRKHKNEWRDGTVRWRNFSERLDRKCVDLLQWYSKRKHHTERVME